MEIKVYFTEWMIKSLKRYPHFREKIQDAVICIFARTTDGRFSKLKDTFYKYKLSKSLLPSNIRENLAHLVKNLDRLANSANGAGRRLSILKPEMIKPICKDLIEMLSDAKECAFLLKNMLLNPAKLKKDELIEEIHKINKQEHVVDIDHLKLHKKLLSIEPPSNPFIAITIHILIEFIESIADSAEDTADFLRIVYLRE